MAFNRNEYQKQYQKKHRQQINKRRWEVRHGIDVGIRHDKPEDSASEFQIPADLLPQDNILYFVYLMP